jgi:ABC-type uncharacterized transport system ATPase subunit
MNDIAIELKGIDKKFGLVHANKNINMKVRKGTIHGIIGENGAGKSTLMSILYGFYQADNGDIFVDGRKTVIKDPNAAISVGIGMVHQHFMLVENFTVLENIMLGAEESQVLNAGITKARRELKQLERNMSSRSIPMPSSRNCPSASSSASRSSRRSTAAPRS